MITILKYTNGSIQRTNNPYRDIIFSIAESDTVLTLSFDLINNYGKKIHTIISEVNKQDNADKITTIVMSEKSGSITSKIVNNYTKIICVTPVLSLSLLSKNKLMAVSEIDEMSDNPNGITKM